MARKKPQRLHVGQYWAVFDPYGELEHDEDGFAIGEVKWSPRCVRVELRRVPDDE